MVQRTLRVATGAEKELLMNTIYQRLPEITDRKIRSKWEQIVQNAANNIFLNEERKVDGGYPTHPSQGPPHQMPAGRLQQSETQTS